MKYSDYKYSYHPKNTSFEVSALLMEEEKMQELGAKTLQATILGKYNNTYDGYSEEEYSGN